MATPSDKEKPVADFLENIFGRTTAITSNVCSSCGKEAKEFKNEVSAKEYTISGLCQLCQDIVFMPENDVPPQCFNCHEYITEGEATKEILVDMDPGDPETGPMPDVGMVTVHVNCPKPSEEELDDKRQLDQEQGHALFCVERMNYARQLNREAICTCELSAPFSEEHD